MKKLLLLSLFLLGFASLSFSQVSVGLNLQNSRNFVTVGTDPDKTFFFDGRLGLGRELGLELVGAYNFVQKSEVNAYFGLGLGLFDHYHPRKDRYYDDTYFAIPVGALIKPFKNKDFGFLIEISPVFYNEYGNYLRGGIGVKYTIR
ncbi:MAG: outer membrane insertion C- signal [Cytophagales bacterium]|nr:MAG: outer membrane insertion C- signal [Cytophagales bacterium]